MTNVGNCKGFLISFSNAGTCIKADWWQTSYLTLSCRRLCKASVTEVATTANLPTAMSVVYTQPFRVAANGQQMTVNGIDMKSYRPSSASPLAQNNAGNPGQDDDDTDSSHIDTNGQAVTKSTTHSFHGNELASQVIKAVSDLVSPSTKSVIRMASVFTLETATTTASTKHFTAKTVKETSPVYDEPSSPLPATYSSDVLASIESVVGSLETDHTLTASVWQGQLGGSTAVTSPSVVNEPTTRSFHGIELTSQVTEPGSDLVSPSVKDHTLTPVISMASVLTLETATTTASAEHFTAKTVKEPSTAYDEPSSSLPATYSSDVLASTESVVGSLETDHTLTPSVWQGQLGGSTAVTSPSVVNEPTTHSFHGNELASQVTKAVSDLVSPSTKSVIPMASVLTLETATATASTKHFTAKTVKEPSPAYDKPSSPLPATYSSDVLASTESVVGSLETDHTLTASVWQGQLGGSTEVTPPSVVTEPTTRSFHGNEPASQVTKPVSDLVSSSAKAVISMASALTLKTATATASTEHLTVNTAKEPPPVYYRPSTPLPDTSSSDALPHTKSVVGSLETDHTLTPSVWQGQLGGSPAVTLEPSDPIPGTISDEIAVSLVKYYESIDAKPSSLYCTEEDGPGMNCKGMTKSLFFPFFKIFSYNPHALLWYC